MSVNVRSAQAPPSTGAAIPPEIADSHPAQLGWRGKMGRITGISIRPGQEELSDRKRQRKQIKHQHAVAREGVFLTARIRREKTRTRMGEYDTCGFLSVMSEKGGVGKTTVASLLAITMAQERGEDIAVVDLNPDRGSLADRMSVATTYSLRDMVNHHQSVMQGLYSPKQFMSQSPGTNVYVLPGDTSPESRTSTQAEDVRLIFQMFAYAFSIAILDNGTGISHSAMQGNLNVSHGTVLVVENTNDAYKFVDSTLERLEKLGFSNLRSRVLLVVNEKVFLPPELMKDTVNSKFSLVTGADISAAYQNRVKNVIVIPFDPALARSGPILYDTLLPETILQVKRLAAALLDDLILDQ